MIDLHGKQFVPAPQTDRERWSEAIEQQHKPTFTVKENDIFAIVNRLGNMVVDRTGNDQFVTGLFCQDTRFLVDPNCKLKGDRPFYSAAWRKRDFPSPSPPVIPASPPTGIDLRLRTIWGKRPGALSGRLFAASLGCRESISPVASGGQSDPRCRGSMFANC
ncbi:glycogen debranching N-terminal domain-containing protein [Oxynema aestuarii]|uniref:Putative glycogen debranching enzyme N-terminal domain-containing protein n=1 Tax=Oxynema aestuarii AP17 TaxID=2064643 RepID=A0A6H1TWJ5_9CYAN|nr:glycogen debranching N-terminal domain-containing protein [Oxynema aestuarii]QIZ70964.1 hypothetical protein HCG48_10505 [Oxynema aestuarii AP17]